jgi:hypothetical protein
MNNPSTRVNIYTSAPAKVTTRGRTLTTLNNEVQIKIPRSGSPAIIKVSSDSIQRNIVLSPINSFAWYTNIYFNWGIGMLVEAKKPLRYTYPRHVYINMADTTSSYHRYIPKQNRYRPAYNKGELHLALSLPYGNIFLLKPNQEPVKTSGGFFGAGIGLDYYHRNNQFINVSATAVSDFPIPFPAPLDRRGEYETMASAYFSISNNHDVRRFSLGYGVTYAFNTWAHNNGGGLVVSPPSHEPVRKSQNAWGLLLSSYYHITPVFSAGITYRPTLLRPSADHPFEYEHLISIGCSWKIKLTGPHTKPVTHTVR